MGGRSRFFWILAAALVAATSARAGGEGVAPIDLRAGRLSVALQDLTDKRRIGILFSPDVIGSLPSPRVAGVLSVEQALDRLLDGSGLSYRRMSGGAFAVFRPPTAEPETPLPEILVVARKTQNADIRRTESDIQPYQVLTARDIAASRADQVGQLIRDRFTSDAHGLTSDPNTNQSSFNIHGLSSTETLVLVDGMRMPSIPAGMNAQQMLQPDLNGLPLFAIDRIEALTATSGGIYGPGATGGVINVVLKRDYRGVEVSTGLGATERGDAVRKRIDVRLGFTPDHGRTDVLLLLSRSTGEGLRRADRDFGERVRRKRIGIDGIWNGASVSDGILIRSQGANLKLKSSLGGADLGTHYLFLPLGYGDLRSGGGQALASAVNAEASPPFTERYDQTSLTPSFATTSFISSVRHDFGASIEGFADVLVFQNDSNRFETTSRNATLSADAPNNIFQQAVSVRLNLPGFGPTTYDKLRTYRVAGGVIAHLPAEWRAEASYSLGGVRLLRIYDSIGPSLDLGESLNGRDLGPGAKPLNIFGGWAALADDLIPYKVRTIDRLTLKQHFQDATLRLAGPLARTEAGPVLLTLLGEWRREKALPFGYAFESPDGVSRDHGQPYAQTVTSLYGELRAPVLARNSRLWPLRGLELQLAGRYDDNLATLPNQDAVDPEGAYDVHRRTLAFVSGFRFRPFEQVMARASLATGALPPTPQLLKPGGYTDLLYNADPRRGGMPPENPAPYTVTTSGSSNVKSERARTWSFGLVLNPEGGSRPRISLDYTRIDKRHEVITGYSSDVEFFLQNESLFPERVKRAPLTAEDVAAGYTGGVVTEIDTSPVNLGRARIEAIDLKADYQIPIGAATVLRLYGASTWTRRFTRSKRLDQPVVSYLGAMTGPMSVRANIGADLDRGAWTVGLNGQVYGRSYDLLAGELYAGLSGARYPAQVYLDLNTAYRVEPPQGSAIRALELRFGVANLFDRRAPVAPGGPSPFGDLRGRRFDATLSAKF